MGFSKSRAKGKVHVKKQDRNQINSLPLHIKQLEKEEIRNPRVSRRKEIINFRTEINENETKETIAKINKTKSRFFEKINKIDKHWLDSSREKGRRIKLAKLEKLEITKDNREIQRIIRDYYQQLHVNKMDNLEEMDKFLEKYNLPKLNHEDIKNLTDHWRRQW